MLLGLLQDEMKLCLLATEKKYESIKLLTKNFGKSKYMSNSECSNAVMVVGKLLITVVVVIFNTFVFIIFILEL